MQTTLKPVKAAPKKRAKPTSDDENSERDEPSIHDDSLLSNTPPSNKKQKKAPAPKKTGGKPLQEMENETIATETIATDMVEAKPKKGSNTDKYQKVGSMSCFSRSLLTFRVAHTTRAHPEATGYLHRLCGEDRDPDVGVQF